LRTVAADADIRLVHVRKLVLAGSTVTRQEFEAAVDRITPNIFVAYGSQRCSATVSFADPEMRRRFPLSIGRLVEGAKAEIVDDCRSPLGAGEVAESAFDQGMIAGIRPAGSERLSFRAGWFYPGDLASRTDEGVLLLPRPADDMMIFNRHQIYPSESRRRCRTIRRARAAAFPGESASHQDIPRGGRSC